jgi:hypothetical protein
MFISLFWSAASVHNLLTKFYSMGKISLRSTSYQAFSFLIVGLYTFLSSSAVEPFNCIKQTDGSFVLAKLRSENCFSGTWNNYAAAIYIFFILYCFIIPSILAYILIKNRKNIGTVEFELNFGSITSPYKRKYYFWELFIVLRRSFFVISNNFLSFQAEDSRYAVGIFFLLGFLFLDVIFAPYKNNNLNLLASS